MGGKSSGASRKLKDAVGDNGRNMLKASTVKFPAEGAVAKARAVFAFGESSKGGVEILGGNLFETDFVEVFLKSRHMLFGTASSGGLCSILMHTFRTYAWNSSFGVGLWSFHCFLFWRRSSL